MSFITSVPMAFARWFLEHEATTGGNMSEQLKRCPFCNGEAQEKIYRTVENGIGTFAFVAKCKECGARVISTTLEGCDYIDLECTHEEVVRLWNRRADVRD